MSHWTKDTLRIATFLASGLEEWPEFSVHTCCEFGGYRNTKMLLSDYGQRYGYSMEKQLRYADEWKEKEE